MKKVVIKKTYGFKLDDHIVTLTNINGERILSFPAGVRVQHEGGETYIKEPVVTLEEDVLTVTDAACEKGIAFKKLTMILKDDLTLEPVEYQFNTELEEILEKKQNILDITDILWQNILVEIPSKVRSTDEDINLEGNGWRVISEEQFQKERNKSNNPFANLDELLNTKEDR